MMKKIKTVDLNTNLLYSEKLIEFHRSFYGLDALGFYINRYLLNQNIKENVIFRVDSADKQNCFNFLSCGMSTPYLKSTIFKGNIVDSFYDTDLFTIKDLYNIKSLLKKYRGKSIGIEFLISDIKYLDNTSLGKRIFDLKWIYDICKKYSFQFILSSGASAYFELISLRVFNVLLEKIGIDVNEYWHDLINWLDDKKVTLYYDSV